LLKIDWAAPFASTMGIPFFSATIASVAVAALPYGPRMNCAFSSVISFWTRVAERLGVLWSSSYLISTGCLTPLTTIPPRWLIQSSHRS